MTLDAWLAANNTVSDKDFARRIGVSRVTLYRLKTHLRKPGQRVMEKIHAETGGEVTPNDFFRIGETSPAPASEPERAA